MSSTILLIDDSAPVREVLRIALESAGFFVLEAVNGHEGVRLYTKHRPALAIVDMVMPEQGGIETVREILAFDPKAVLFTVFGKDATEEYETVARQLGAKRGFLKPVKIAELIVAIRQHVTPFVATFERVYEEGVRITVQSRGILIEALDYHAKPLFLDRTALAELGLTMGSDEEVPSGD